MAFTAVRTEADMGVVAANAVASSLGLTACRSTKVKIQAASSSADREYVNAPFPQR
ncbi:protein of unknown function (plasmid) [Pararobbsia alpina]